MRRNPADPLLELRHAVADASRTLAAEGLVTRTQGNVSARDGDHVAITPAGSNLGELRAGQVTIVDRSGELVAGRLAPSSELPLHLAVYEHHGVGAVVHTHSPSATAVACTLEGELPCIHYEMVLLGGPVRVAPYRRFGSPELAEVAIEALRDRRAALLANHGAVAVGDTLEEAVGAARLLEWLCDLLVRARAVGTPSPLSAEEVEKARAEFERRGYSR
ncbi:MAG: class II aldolase/adducin family protein [Thermoleophilum sp.]|nr:class II aldolase/adducin family protein [Thermoleophilum sp.]